ncbi:MAG: glycosyltransferase [Candidatus Zixiibacteriota bacterium]
MVEIFLWSSIGLLLYIYIGYYFVLMFLCVIFGKKESKIKTSNYNPLVSIIVAAYNEEKVIRSKILNLLELEFPKENIEIIIASDGSTDNTVSIAKEFESETIRVLEFEQNRGRASVHNDAVTLSHGEILIFTDVETTFAPDFLQKALVFFQDPQYGCGTGDYTFEAQEKFGHTESVYWRLEKRLLKMEHQLGILPFASGGCLIIRKSLWSPIPEHSDIDNCLPYRVVRMGYKVFYAENARAYDVTIEDSQTHYRKRVRTALRGIHGLLMELPPLLRKGCFKSIFVLISHRMMRYFTGCLLVIAILINIWLLAYDQMVYKVTILLQALFYCLALLGWLEDKGLRSKIFEWIKYQQVIYSFLLANIAFSVAIFKAMTGVKIKGYKPASH